MRELCPYDCFGPLEVWFVRKVGFLVLVTLLLAAVPSFAASSKPVAPVGVVVLAQGAQVSHLTAENGTTLYPGDTLSTDDKGMLRVRFGSSQLMMGPLSVVKIAQGPHGVRAILQRGVMRFSAAGSPLELQALAAIVDPQNDSASGELVVVGPAEFQIASTQGNLDVDIDGEGRTVAESTAYDVTLQPINASATADPQTIGGARVRGIWLLIALILLLTAGSLYLATISSSHF